MPETLPPRVLRREVLVVFAVSLGAEGLRALVELLGDLTSGLPLGSLHASLIVSQAPGRPWLDLALQLVGIATSLAPVALVLHLLGRSDRGAATIGLDLSEPTRDLARGVVLAAIVGSCGLALYLAAHQLGLAVTLNVVDLPAVWWRIPIEVLSALHDGLLEEIVVLGYLLTRLDQLGWSRPASTATSAAVRGSYHLYQGLGGFVGNAVMGVLFALLYRRWGRVTPLIVAHTFIDVGALVGYTELAGHVGWLPT